jgi:hypothetical protein
VISRICEIALNVVGGWRATLFLALIGEFLPRFEKYECQRSVDTLPVSAEILVYTESEWESLQS